MKIETLVSTYNTPLYRDSLDIRQQVFVDEQQISRNLEIDEFEPICDYFLTTLDGVAASTGRLRVKEDWIKFERIATLAKLRGKGTGSALMKAMQEHARSQYPHLTPYMHSQDSAVSFYEKLGWQKEGAPFVEADIPHQAMVLLSNF